jgi:hypothetical protein
MTLSLLDYNFIVKCCLSFSIITTHACVFYIDTTLADGTYELIPESKIPESKIPESESKRRAVNLNLTEVVEDLDQSSKEPNANSAQEGKPWIIIHIFKLCNILLLSTCVFIGVY